MEFWGVEVKSGQPLDVNLGEGKVLHLSQACLGETKNNKNESVCLYVNINEKKLVLGTLHPERLPQQLFDLVIDKDFQLSHNWKNGSIYFYGYKADQPIDDEDDSEEIDTDEEEEALRLPLPNGKQEAKKEEKLTAGPSKKEAAGKQKVKIVEPEKDEKDDSDDSDDSASSDASDSDEDDEDSSDDEEDSDEEEETPKKEQSGKKRPNESAMKTPVSDKKAKLSTPPQKTDGKKAGGHVATPHPSKQAATKTPANKSNQKSPASAADGAHSCKSCNRSFKSDMALQSHNQAKHK